MPWDYNGGGLCAVDRVADLAATIRTVSRGDTSNWVTSATAVPCSQSETRLPWHVTWLYCTRTPHVRVSIDLFVFHDEASYARGQRIYRRTLNPCLDARSGI